MPKLFSFQVVAVGYNVVRQVNIRVILGIIMSIEEVAADERWVVIVRIGPATFVGTVKRSAGISLAFLLVDVNCPLGTAATDFSKVPLA